MLADAYRELNARRLFWIALVVSAAVALVFTAVGISDSGISVLGWTFENQIFNAKTISPPTFYKYLFLELGCDLWLTWAASILALLSTAHVFPDLLASGSIELTLSKPISRLRLFFSKYIAGLLFVTLQVAFFTTAGFLVIGFRSGDWDLRIFIAVPLIVLAFSFLFSICVFFGVMTRSATSAIILTLIVWFVMFLINTAEGALNYFGASYSIAQDLHAAKLTEAKADQTALMAAKPAESAPAEQMTKWEAQTAEIAARLTRINTGLLEVESSGRPIILAHQIVLGVRTVLPKTSETTDLLGRWIFPDNELAKLFASRPGGGPRGQFPLSRGDVQVSPRMIQDELDRDKRSRTVGWILGTSIAFEVLLLGFTAWRFRRRDF